MKIHRVIFVLILAWASNVSGQDYLEIYSRGSLAVQLANCVEGEQLLNEALKLKSKGDMKRNYFPHYYLAVCALERDDLEAAKTLGKQAEGSGISFSALAKDYSKFKSKLQAKLKEPKQQKLVLVVVVNTENKVKNLSTEQLQQIFRGEMKTWEDGTPIIPVLAPQGSTENRVFLAAMGNMDEKTLAALYETAKTTPPTMIEKNEWILRYVFSNPGAIAFYPNSSSLQQVKVITVDGKNPTDNGYPITQ